MRRSFVPARWFSGRTIVTGLAVASALVVAACGSSGTSTAGGAASTTAKAHCPVKILLITSLTGFNSATGLSAKTGEQIAVDDLNKAGGVLGCPISLTTEDDASDTTKDIPLAQQALASHQYSQIFAYGYGAAELVPLLNTQKQLYISGLGTDSLNAPSKFPYFFDSNIDLIPTTTKVAELMKSKGYHHIALVTDQSLYGQTNETALKNALPSSDIAGSVSVNDDIVDATPIALSVKSLHPDAIFVDLFGTTLGHVLTAFQQNGVTAPLFGSQSAIVTDIVPLVSSPAVYHGMIVAGSSTMSTGATNPGLAAFVRACVAASNGKLLGGMASYALEASATAIWAAAVNATGTLTNVNALKSWLESNGSKPITGNFMTSNNSTGYSTTNHAIAGPGSIVFAVMGKLINGQREPYSGGKGSS
jgi:ABC-type branched-subunit amino acid transport system substrate-binding protein